MRQLQSKWLVNIWLTKQLNLVNVLTRRAQREVHTICRVRPCSLRASLRQAVAAVPPAVRARHRPKREKILRLLLSTPYPPPVCWCTSVCTNWRSIPGERFRMTHKLTSMKLKAHLAMAALVLVSILSITLTSAGIVTYTQHTFGAERAATHSLTAIAQAGD